MTTSSPDTATSDPERPTGTFRHIHNLHPLMLAHLESMVLRGRQRTARTAAEVYIPFLRWVRDLGQELTTLTREDLDRYQDHLVNVHRTPAGKPLARSTAATRIFVIKAFFTWLTNRGHLVSNPARHLGLTVVRSRVVAAEHLTLQEATALVQTQAALVDECRAGSPRRLAGLRNLAAIALALATGRRIGGLLGLTVEQLDRQRNELRVDREKGHQGRVLPVAAWAMDLVGTYLDQARPHLVHGAEVPWLFLNSDGTKPAEVPAMASMLARLLDETIQRNPDLTDLPGKSITWHSLRVSFATMLFANGCDIRSVNELMLYRDLSTTARYTPIPVEDLRAVFRGAHPRS